MEEPITREELAQSPTWFPLELAGPDSVRLIRLDEAAYRAASFLDRRILGAKPEEAICDAKVLRAAAATIAPQLHYIFHIGHVGSTLISRIIGEHERLFSVREPALLREPAAPGWDLAKSQGQLAVHYAEPTGALGLAVLLRLLARTWRREQRAVVKATSFVSEIAPAMLACSEHPAAVLLFARPVAYLRTILGGPNSRLEAQRLAPSRLRRLARRLGTDEWLAGVRSEGEHLAMSWLCEMTALHEAASGADRMLWVDFDDFLADPATGVVEILRTVGAEPIATRDIEALLASPLMRRYSKSPEHAYDAKLRAEVLAAADRQHGAEVRRGMEWLRGMGLRHAMAARALEASGPGRQASPGLPPL